MVQGLSVQNVVRVNVNISPLAVPFRNFGAVLHVGASDVIDISERIRTYTSIEGVAAEFGITAPEYLSAKLHFAQTPQPAILYIGRWAKTDTPGILKGAILTPAQQLMSNFTSIGDGAFGTNIDGNPVQVTGLDFTAETNLNGVADVITAGFAGDATCVWDGVNKRFIITSATTGVVSSVGFGTAPTGPGTDIRLQLGIASTQATQVGGSIAESLLDCWQLMADISSEWYAGTTADTTATDADHIAVAGFIQSLEVSRSRIYGITSKDTGILTAGSDADIASQLKISGYARSTVLYSTTTDYAVASMLGRMSVVNFQGSNTTITLKFKQLPGVIGETLSETQALTLRAKNANVFVNYANGTAILQEGVMSNGYFIDEVHGSDWLQNQVQTNVWNLFYQSQTKIPQTDAGTNEIIAEIKSAFEVGVRNGLIAPGIWNSDGFGQIQRGTPLTTGYYIYAPPVSLQAQADREARKSVPIQCAVKYAGAVHFTDIQISVNR